MTEQQARRTRVGGHNESNAPDTSYNYRGQRREKGRNADEAPHNPEKSRRHEEKPGFWSHLKGGASHGTSATGAGKARISRDDDHENHARRHGKHQATRGTDHNGGGLPLPPPEAEEALCKKCHSIDHIVYINPKTRKPYDEKFRRRPETCDHCGRIWPEGKPYSRRMQEKIERRFAKPSKYDNLFFCHDCNLGDAERGMSEEDLDRRNSRPRGRKRALLIGINYEKQDRSLDDCSKDIKSIQDHLVRKHDYDKEDIAILIEDWGHYRHPTREEILRQMHWLVKDSKEGDFLFLLYSGHGGQTVDREEDEGIYPVDYQLKDSEGILNDNEMHHILTNIPKGVHLTAVFGSCHSNSVLGLPYVHDEDKLEMVRVEHDKGYNKEKKKGKGTVIVWSGCKVSERTRNTRKRGWPVGATSHAFFRANYELSKTQKGYTNEELRLKLDDILKRYGQRPLLSSNVKLNLEDVVEY